MRNPSVELFIGNDDHILRRAALDLNVRVPAKAESQLSGITSLGVAVTVNYGQLNRPQKITPPAPAQVKPYRQLSRQLSGLALQLEGSAAGGSAQTGSGSAGASGASGTGASGTGASGTGASGTGDIRHVRVPAGRPPSTTHACTSQAATWPSCRSARR